MKEVQGASRFENTSLETARTILSTVVKSMQITKIIFSLMRQVKKNLTKFPTYMKNRCNVRKRLSREGLLLSITLRLWEPRKLDSDKNENKKCSP